ncbi:MAG: signal transduction histidine kinase [Deltaproteobacteria bacterium]|nr:signal transduction histidine kinase [Deltaproteobacteria bacterium]
MSLRQKLALGFGGILLVIAVIGVHNITRISALGQSIDVILRENYRSVVACQEMKEALERMDSGAVFVLLGAEQKGNDQIAQNAARFEKALQVESGNITIPGEGEKAERLKQLYGQFRSDIKVMGDPAFGREARRKAYFDKLLPMFQQLKDTADDILRMNQEHMVAMDARARQQALSVRGQMYMMLLAATIVAAGFLFLTGKWILRPITRLTNSAKEIRKGNLDLVLPGGSGDEFGQLSEAFNEMTASLREFRRNGQARLLRIQRSTQQAFDALPEAIAVLNPEGEVEVGTDAAGEAFGLRPKVRVPDLPYPWMANLFEEALRKGRTTELEGIGAVVQQFVRNEERFYRPKAVPILDPGGAPAGVVLILHDVTQQRLLDEKKSGAISAVSHQLKTPLTSIRMAIHLLLEEKVGGLSPKQTDLLVAAGDEAERLNTIIDELLDIGRIESGKARMDLRPVPPIDLVSREMEAYRPAARDGGVSLVVDLPATLPQVWVDPNRVAHVFANLLSNALKYTPPGGKVTLSAKEEGEFVRFQVSDTGVGIPEKYLPRIFEQFFRVPDQGPGLGVGLGLAIVKDIVESHGGTVGVESREGMGSTFHFTLRRTDHGGNERRRT